MSFTKQRTEILVLMALSIILAAVLYVQFVLLPLMSECTELEERIGEEQFSLSVKKMDILSAERLAADNEALRGRISYQRSLLSPHLSAEELDIRMMTHFVASGLSVLTLDIASVYDVDTDISIHTAEYTAEGTYSSLLELISLVNCERGMAIDSISVRSDSTGGRAASSQRLIFTIGISLYMEGV